MFFCCERSDVFYNRILSHSFLILNVCGLFCTCYSYSLVTCSVLVITCKNSRNNLPDLMQHFEMYHANVDFNPLLKAHLGFSIII